MFEYSQVIYYLQDESTNFATETFKLNQVFICPKILRNPKSYPTDTN